MANVFLEANCKGSSWLKLVRCFDFMLYRSFDEFTDKFRVISLVSDFAFASFPILLLWKVQIKLRRKIALCFLMGFGVM